MSANESVIVFDVRTGGFDLEPDEIVRLLASRLKRKRWVSFAENIFSVDGSSGCSVKSDSFHIVCFSV